MEEKYSPNWVRLNGRPAQPDNGNGDYRSGWREIYVVNDTQYEICGVQDKDVRVTRHGVNDPMFGTVVWSRVR